jgi:hypothetical protein
MSRTRIGLAATAAIAALVLLTPEVAANEEPSYEIEARDGAFEIRHYAPYVVAETLVEGDFKQASGQAFMRLFRYISGKNRRQLRPDDPKISMTAPVTMRQVGDATRMTFMVPGKYTLETAPQPADPAVQLRGEPGGLVAVLTYSGRSTQERFLEREVELRDWLASRGLEANAEALFAGYDAPFKPWFLRRNEVLIPLTAENQGAL